MQHLINILIILSSILLSSCSIFDVVNAFNQEAESLIQRDIEYGAHPRHKLDAYTPVSPAKNAVVFIFFYGGGWVSGNREDYAFVARKLAAMGHFAFVPDYRLYPQVRFPQFVEDGADATAYILENLVGAANRRRPVFLMGHSAGAHIALLLALDRSYLVERGREPDELAGVIGLAGPYDFLPLESGLLQNIFPASQGQFQSQPINYARNDGPPVLLAHGTDDKRVRPRNSLNMAKAIEQKGGEVVLRMYPGTSHTDMLKPFISFLQDNIGLLDDIVVFLTARAEADRIEPRKNLHGLVHSRTLN